MGHGAVIPKVMGYAKYQTLKYKYQTLIFIFTNQGLLILILYSKRVPQRMFSSEVGIVYIM